jgi:hypothetical protein
MKGIPREVSEHKLNIKPGSNPVKQRLHRFNDEKCKAIGEEIVNLLSAGFIREVFHPMWLANPVLVTKKNKKWRMCIANQLATSFITLFGAYYYKTMTCVLKNIDATFQQCMRRVF